MPHETYLAPDERRLIARFWQSAAEVRWRVGLARLAPSWITDRNRAAAAAGSVSAEFLEFGILKRDRAKGRSGYLGAGAVFCAAWRRQSYLGNRVGLGPHDHAAQMARVAEQPPL